MKRRWLLWGVALALGALFIFVQLARSLEPLALDQGLFACFGRWVPRGALPYRDLYDTKPPLHLYTWALGFGLGGSATSMWCFEALWLAATLALAFLLARKLWGAWAGVAAATLMMLGLWAPGFGGWWSRAQAEELMVLPMLGAAWFALAAITAPRRAALAGVVTGVVGLYKLPGMAVAAAWLALWLGALGLARWRDSARRLGWFAAGLAAPWLVTIAWFAAHGAAGDLYDAIIVHQRHYAAVIAPPWSWVARELPRVLARQLGLLLLPGAIGLLLLWFRDRPRALWLTTWIAISIITVAVQRQLAGYHYLLIVPGLALAAGYGLALLPLELSRGRAAHRVLAAGAAFAILILAARTTLDWRDAYGPGARHRFGALSRADYLASFPRGLLSPAVEEDAGRYLAAHTRPGDGILVWGLSPGIYALADRHPVTRYPFHKLLLTDAPLSRLIPGLAARRADLLRRLHADAPAYILIGTQDRNPFEPQDSVQGLRAFADLAAFIKPSYREETRIGRFVVLRRISAM